MKVALVISYTNVYRHVETNIKYPPLIKICLFCKSEKKAFTAEEHIFPESLGNKKIILPRGVVCNSCNNDFSSIENKFVSSHPNLFWRFYSMSNRWEGKPTKVDLPGGGFIRRIEPSNSLPIIQIKQICTPEELERSKTQFDPDASEHSLPPIEFRSDNTQQSSRVLAKIALELLYLYFPKRAFSADFDPIRYFAMKALKWREQYIPYACGIHTGQPFVHRLLELDLETHSNLYAFFTIPGVKYLYPLSQPRITASFSLLSREMGLEIMTQRQRLKSSYSLNFQRV